MLRSFAFAVTLLVVMSDTAAAQTKTPTLATYSSKVVDKCTGDASKLCPEHALGSAEMRYCMEAKSKMISRDCLIALEDDGIIPRGSVKNARR